MVSNICHLCDTNEQAKYKLMDSSADQSSDVVEDIKLSKRLQMKCQKIVLIRVVKEKRTILDLFI